MDGDFRRWAAFIMGLGFTGCSAAVDEPIGVKQAALERSCGTKCSTWVYPSVFSKDLIYVPDNEGDRIPDFSQVGYRRGVTGLLSEQLPPQGGDALLDIDQAGEWQALVDSLRAEIDPVTQQPYCQIPTASNTPPPTSTSAPSNICNSGIHDHGAVIQCLIKRVGRRTTPGAKGRVYLPRGHYAVHQTLQLEEGVVLRGVSAFGTGAPTTLHACGTVSPLINIEGGHHGTLTGARHNILDDVPVGANSVQVTGNHGLQKDQMVRITRTYCDVGPDGERDAGLIPQNCPHLLQWVDDINMLSDWAPLPIEFQRKITHIQPVEESAGTGPRSRIFFDLPLTNALESAYGPHTIQGYSTPSYSPKNVGIMKIRGVSHLNEVCPVESTCETRQTMIKFQAAEDSWVYDVVAQGFSNAAVDLGVRARFCTVEKVSYIEPWGQDDGQFRYAFWNRGQMNLIARTYSELARHDHILPGGVPGPNVVLESDTEQTIQEAGPHQQWATGTLFDNLSLNSPGHTDQNPLNWSAATLNARNVSGLGDGHGYSGANMVAWNTHAVGAGEGGYFYFNLPSAQNWLIGNTGGALGPPNAAWGESLPHADAFNGQNAGKLITTTASGGALPDPTIGDSLYRSALYMYGPASHGNDEVQIRHYLVGDIDNFTPEATDTVNDQVYVNPAFKTWVGTTLAAANFAGFDYTTNANGNSDAKSVAASIRYDIADDQSVVTGYLAMRVRRAGSWGSNADHFLQIAGAGTQPADFAHAKTYYWQCGSGTPTNCQQLPADLTGPLGWNSGTGPSVRIIELPRSTFATILDRRTTAAPRKFGEVNVNFTKKTRLDWLVLTLVIKKNIPD